MATPLLPNGDRIGCGFLAKLAAERRRSEDEGREVAADLACRLPKRAYKLDALPARPVRVPV